MPHTRVPTRPAVSAGSKPTAVFVDGSALYLATKATTETTSYKLNYRVLVDILCRQVAGLTPALPSSKVSLWAMWTAAAPENLGQNNFLEFVERELHWGVRRAFPSQAFVIEPSALFGLGGGDSARMARLVRFDAAISFAMGRLAESHRIVVVSDSYPLFEPLSRVAANFGPQTAQPVIAFFGRSLDPRWHVAVNQQHAPKLINLDEFEAELFGMPQREETLPAAQAGSTNLVY